MAGLLKTSAYINTKPKNETQADPGSQKRCKKNEPVVKPEPETLHTTDPQQNMEGPVSSLMHKTGEAFDTDETKEEADNKKDRKM